MEELKYALKGGNTVADVKNITVEEEEKEVETSFTADQNDDTENSSSSENENVETSFAASDKKDDEQASDDPEEDTQEDSKDNDDADDVEDDKDDEEKRKYSALENQYNELKTNFEALENEVKELRLFKHNVESKQKDDLIGQFYMLSEEDKKDVVENKDKYSLDEIKSKLAVICFEKKVNFNLETSSKNEEEKKETEKPVTTFNINNTEDSVPDWVKRVEQNL